MGSRTNDIKTKTSHTHIGLCMPRTPNNGIPQVLTNLQPTPYPPKNWQCSACGQREPTVNPLLQDLSNSLRTKALPFIAAGSRTPRLKRPALSPPLPPPPSPRSESVADLSPPSGPNNAFVGTNKGFSFTHILNPEQTRAGSEKAVKGSEKLGEGGRKKEKGRAVWPTKRMSRRNGK